MRYKVKVEGYILDSMGMLEIEKEIRNIDNIMEGIKEFKEMQENLKINFGSLRINIYDSQDNLLFSFKLDSQPFIS